MSNEENVVEKKKKKPFYKRIWFWVLVILFVAVLSAPSKKSNSDEHKETVIPSSESQEMEVPQPEETTVPADAVYHVGDTIDVTGLKVTYLSCEQWTDYPQFFDPKEGYQYIRIGLNAKNDADSDRYISAFDFKCYADGKKQEQNYLADDILEGGELSSGREDEGYIYFEVPADASEIEIEYETNIWTDKKAILLVQF